MIRTIVPEGVFELAGRVVKFHATPMPLKGDAVRLVLSPTRTLDVVVTGIGECGYVTSRRITCIPRAPSTTSRNTNSGRSP